tara:strand:+ start:728 stop:949 length:222 start_codon:yes stop_codon:yes gene_type:complete
MTIENLKLAVRAMGSVINDLTNELDEMQEKYDDLKRDERRYYQWWHEETKKTDKLQGILDTWNAKPVDADESN